MKPAIPSAPKPGDRRERFDQAVRENLEIITGRRGEKIKPLADGASLADVVAKVNEIIARLQ